MICPPHSQNQNEAFGIQSNEGSKDIAQETSAVLFAVSLITAPTLLNIVAVAAQRWRGEEDD